MFYKRERQDVVILMNICKSLRHLDKIWVLNSWELRIVRAVKNDFRWERGKLNYRMETVWEFFPIMFL